MAASDKRKYSKSPLAFRGASTEEQMHLFVTDPVLLAWHMPRPRKPASPFRYFNSSPEVIRLVVMMYVRFPLSLRNVEDLLIERGIDICHETVRQWWNRFGPMFAGDIRRQRVSRMRGFRQWKWHLDGCCLMGWTPPVGTDVPR
jgi:putative transposase